MQLEQVHSSKNKLSGSLPEIHIVFGACNSFAKESLPFQYQILDRIVHCNRRIAALSGFESNFPLSGRLNQLVSNHAEHLSPDSKLSPQSQTYTAQIYDRIVTIVHRRTKEVEYLILHSDIHLRIDHLAQLIQVSTPPEFDQVSAELLAMGPGLVSLLMPANICLLHASAILTPAGVVIFCGSSGAGKSTLARELSQVDTSFSRLADDIVVISVDSHGCRCLAKFPQPKLSTEQQPGLAKISLQIHRIIFLSPSDQSKIIQSNLGMADISFHLINHTMGSNNPDPSVRQKLLVLATNVAEKIHCQVFQYPHLRRSIDQMQMIIKESL